MLSIAVSSDGLTSFFEEFDAPAFLTDSAPLPDSVRTMNLHSPAMDVQFSKGLLGQVG